MKAKKITLIFLLVALISKNHFGQKEGNIWYFGQNAGIDFNSGTALALTNGSMSTTEGCASISDSVGNLLFYTDGDTVWDKTHAPMLNGTGLMGCWSATQSAMIICMPKSVNKYYIFTVDCIENSCTNGLRYSEVDMSLNGGLGSVTSLKNILLFAPASEKLTATLAENGSDLWVIAHDYTTNNFRSYSVSSSGVNSTPQISNVGSPMDYGYMKVSPDGKKIASARDTAVDLFDFDSSTGAVSNRLTINRGEENYYGLEFSPNGTILYTINYSAISTLHQFDLQAGSNSNIINSKKIIARPTQTMPGAMQLAPDGKIYIAQHDPWAIASSYLSFISSPNTLGTACNYVENAFYLNGKKSELGLPNIMTSYYYTPLDLVLNIPNVFTPNGDGLNDAFTVEGLTTETSLQVYNRWGVKIYDSANYGNDWDGRSSSGEIFTGVYYYVMKTKTGEKYSGFVTIIG